MGIFALLNLRPRRGLMTLRTVGTALPQFLAFALLGHPSVDALWLTEVREADRKLTRTLHQPYTNLTPIVWLVSYRSTGTAILRLQSEVTDRGLVSAIRAPNREDPSHLLAMLLRRWRHGGRREDAVAEEYDGIG